MKVYTQSFGSLTEYVLYNSTTGDTATILPEWGGIVRSLKLHKNTDEYEVICAATTEKMLRAETAFASGHMVPWPSRIEGGRYSFEGESYQLPINEEARQNAIHGLVHHEVFEVIEEKGDAHTAHLTLRHQYTGKEAGYPFPFDFYLTYSLNAQGRLTLTYAIHNTGEKMLPLGLGWHPYFHLGDSIDELHLAFPAEATYFLDNQMLPVAKDFFLEASSGFLLQNRDFDTPYLLYRDKPIATTQLTSTDQDVTLNVWQETGEGKFNFLVVYTPPGRQRVAIEPMTANVNAFNSGDGLITLKPGEEWKAECGVFLS